MRAKALRLPDNLLNAVKFAQNKEKLDEPNTLRKFLRLGVEKYIGDGYARGELTLREAASVLDITLLETLDLFLDMGIAGNVDADKCFKAITFAGKMAVKL
jgi:hypothetical protein